MTTQIKYVGLKDAEAAFQDKTGIVWTPGSSHPIEPALASRMLQHPDVFARDDAAPVTKATAKTLPTAPALALAATTNSEAGNVDNANGQDTNQTVSVLDGLDKVALHALAKEKGVEVKWNASADNVRKALTEAGIK